MSLDFSDLRTLGASIRPLPDAEIEASVSGRGVESTLEQVFAALTGAFLPERAPRSAVTIAWKLDRPEGQQPVYLTVDRDGCRFARGEADCPQATLVTTTPVFLRLVSGALSGMQAYARNQLHVEGDMVLALRQITFFDVDSKNAELDLSTPEELARLIEGRNDGEIMEAAEITGLERVFERVFQGMIDHFLPAKAAGHSGVIEWRLRTSQGIYVYHMRIAAGRCSVERGPAYAPRVRLSASLPVFLRLVAGRLNGMQAFADSLLEVTGDLVLAQLQQTFFNADLSQAELNVSTPSGLARLIRDRTDAEIEAGITVTGVDRALDLVFRGMVDHYLPAKAGNRRAVVQWDFQTPEGPRSYQFVSDRGRCHYLRGCSEKANVRLSATLPNFLRIAAGQLNGIVALATGRIKVQGNILLARSQQGWFDLTR
jgi:putative sterol carrier protein